MLIITGTGRCGTSVLAEFCRRCGYETGGTWSERRNAGREHPAAVAANERLYRMLCEEQSVATGWQRDYRQRDRWSRVYSADLDECAAAVRALETSVIKDPRFLWHPRIIRFWCTWQPRLRVLLLCRNFDDAASSAAQALKPDTVRSAGESRQNFAEFVLTLAEHEIPFQCLAFPAFLQQFDRVYAALTEFGHLAIDRKEGLALWNDLIDLSKVHQYGCSTSTDER